MSADGGGGGSVDRDGVSGFAVAVDLSTELTAVASFAVELLSLPTVAAVDPSTDTATVAPLQSS